MGSWLARNLAFEGLVVAQVLGLLIECRGDHQDRRVGGEVRELVPHPGADEQRARRVIEVHRLRRSAIIEMDAAAAMQGDQRKLRFAMTVPPAPLAWRDVMQPE